VTRSTLARVLATSGSELRDGQCVQAHAAVLADDCAASLAPTGVRAAVAFLTPREILYAVTAALKKTGHNVAPTDDLCDVGAIEALAEKRLSADGGFSRATLALMRT